MNESYSGKVIISTKKYSDMILKQLLELGIEKSDILDINGIKICLEVENIMRNNLSKDWKNVKDLVIYGFVKVAHDNIKFFIW